jgi:hypothetical protein
MSLSLDQAIEIHAEVLKRRHVGHAPARAREQATVLKAKGDHEGHAVWTRVAEHAEYLLRETKEPVEVASASE